jgi:DNA-3-methyladenine glycosylase II
MPNHRLNLLTRKTYHHALSVLAAREPDFAYVLKTIDKPPMWLRRPGFPTLVQIILEQQVSLNSAKAAFDRLRNSLHPLTAINFLKLDDFKLKKIGFSRQKIKYCRGLALKIKNGELRLQTMHEKNDLTVISELTAIKGIGIWTAHIYLLMALRRPDIWPGGDLALISSLQKLKGLAKRPTSDELERVAKNWEPWRSVAARILWHYYLNG